MLRKYDCDYKVQAVKLTKEVVASKVARELGVPTRTATWVKAASAMSLNEEIIKEYIENQEDDEDFKVEE